METEYTPNKEYTSKYTISHRRSRKGNFKNYYK